MKEMDPKLAKMLARLEKVQNSDWPGDLEIDGYKLTCTCPACPEQYNVFNSAGSKVGYLRLRHGWFRADAPCCGGETVYSTNTKGDGVFDDDERLPELTKAIAAIKDYWNKLLRKD